MKRNEFGIAIITGKYREYVNSRGYRAIECDSAVFVKIGDPVYIVGGKYRHGSIEYWINPGKFRLSDVGKLGLTVFLTLNEAQEKLEEWKKNNYDPTYDLYMEG